MSNQLVSVSVDLALINSEELKEKGLNLAASIAVVRDDVSLDAATEAKTALDDTIKFIEKERKKMKAPVIEIGRKIDETAEIFLADVKKEQLRINRVIGNYVTEKRIEQEREEAKRRMELKRLEEEQQAKLAQAKTAEEVRTIQAETQNQVEMLPPAQTFNKPANLSVKPEFDFEVTDIHALYRAHPVCVKLDVLRSEVKALINMDPTRKIPGVRVFEDVKLSTRSRGVKTIDV